MIRVQLQPEPEGFHRDVTEPGRRWVAERSEAGQAITARDLPPLWRQYLPQLRTAYGEICAYVCLWIPSVTGSASTDHFVAKSAQPERAYDWDNLRLACDLMNSRKGACAKVLDPFEVGDGWFAMDPSTYALRPAEGLDPATAERVKRTIDRLRLGGDPARYQGDVAEANRHDEVREARSHWGDAYLAGHISREWLEQHSPFVAREFARVGLEPVADASPTAGP